MQKVWKKNVRIKYAIKERIFFCLFQIHISHVKWLEISQFSFIEVLQKAWNCDIFAKSRFLVANIRLIDQCGSLNENGPIGSYIWIPQPQLVELFGKN